MKQQDAIRSGELARRAGVSRDTLRHYERSGVLPRPRRFVNNYREYPLQALDRVRVIRGALALGFTLEELARVLRSRDNGGRPCAHAREIAAAKLARLDELMRELAALRSALRATLRDWDGRLARLVPGARAGLLENIPNIPRATPAPGSAAAFLLQRRRVKGATR